MCPNLCSKTLKSSTNVLSCSDHFLKTSPWRVNRWFKIYLPLSCCRQVPSSKEIFLPTFTGCLQHISTLLEVWNTSASLQTQQNQETSLPIQRQNRGFLSSQSFFRFCAHIPIKCAPITHFPQVQYGQISQLGKHIGEYLKNCIHCFSIVGIFKASQVQRSLLGTFFTAAFLGKRNAVTKDVQSLSFLFCKICRLYHCLQYKTSINNSTMTN